MSRYIDADKLIEGRVYNDPVVIAVKCAPVIDEATIVGDALARMRCCLCPGAVCPGIKGTPHPEDTPCKFFERGEGK